MSDGRTVSHRKGVAISHDKIAKRRKYNKSKTYSLNQMIKDVDAGFAYFWSQPKRKNLREWVDE